MQPAVPALPAADDPAMRAVLRDGSIARLKVADQGDCEAVRRFFHDLSPESRRLRFFTIAQPAKELVARLCDSSDPGRGVTLLAMRLVDEQLRPIAVGSYIAIDHATAEAAFAVDDRFQGKGLGTILLERLAAMAAQRGFRRFEAITLPDNHAMLEVFHDSGFEIRSKSDPGTVTVTLSLSPTNETVAAADRRVALATAQSLRPVLEPASVAVLGASRDPSSIGRRVLRALVNDGFHGPIYPVNPAAT